MPLAPDLDELLRLLSTSGARFRDRLGELRPDSRALWLSVYRFVRSGTGSERASRMFLAEPLRWCYLPSSPPDGAVSLGC